LERSVADVATVEIALIAIASEVVAVAVTEDRFVQVVARVVAADGVLGVLPRSMPGAGEVLADLVPVLVAVVAEVALSSVLPRRVPGIAEVPAGVVPVLVAMHAGVLAVGTHT